MSSSNDDLLGPRVGQVRWSPHAARLAGFTGLLLDLDLDLVERIADAVRGTFRSGGSVYTAGNGGSASSASHFAADLRRAAQELGHPGPVRVWSLLDMVATTTAVANDYGYDQVFAVPLRQSAAEGDLLIALSVSGESLNLVAATHAARAAGMTVAALTGQLGSSLSRMADVAIEVPGEDYGQVEDAHSWICHAIAASLHPARRVTQQGL